MSKRTDPRGWLGFQLLELFTDWTLQAGVPAYRFDGEVEARVDRVPLGDGRKGLVLSIHLAGSAPSIFLDKLQFELRETAAPGGPAAKPVLLTTNRRGMVWLPEITSATYTLTFVPASCAASGGESAPQRAGTSDSQGSTMRVVAAKQPHILRLLSDAELRAWAAGTASEANAYPPVRFTEDPLTADVSLESGGYKICVWTPTNEVPRREIFIRLTRNGMELLKRDVVLEEVPGAKGLMHESLVSFSDIAISQEDGKTGEFEFGFKKDSKN